MPFSPSLFSAILPFCLHFNTPSALCCTFTAECHYTHQFIIPNRDYSNSDQWMANSKSHTSLFTQLCNSHISINQVTPARASHKPLRPTTSLSQVTPPVLVVQRQQRTCRNPHRPRRIDTNTNNQATPHHSRVTGRTSTVKPCPRVTPIRSRTMLRTRPAPITPLRATTAVVVAAAAPVKLELREYFDRPKRRHSEMGPTSTASMPCLRLHGGEWHHSV